MLGQILLGVIIVCAGAGYVLHVAHEVGPLLPARATTGIRARSAAISSAARIPAGQVRTRVAKGLRQMRGRTVFQRVVFKGAPPPGVKREPAREPLKLVKPAPAASAPVPRPASSAAPVLTEVKPMANAATPGGAGADLFAAVQHIINHASAGGVRSKLRAITQFDEALGYEAGSLDGFAKRLAEPDQSYSAAVWEPVAMAAAHMRAAQMQMAEAGSALRHVMSVTVGEAASSGTRVPHHDQINSGQ